MSAVHDTSSVWRRCAACKRAPHPPCLTPASCHPLYPSCTVLLLRAFTTNVYTPAIHVGTTLSSAQASPGHPAAVSLLPAAARQRSPWFGPSRPQLPAALGGQQPHLSGQTAGDYGFDPLGLSADPAAFAKYQEAELLHAR
jgi:hypothetical protein